ncbi:MAG TPA: response regulator [Rickettsiales bacterium]|nr:response regulator [Rickettsiales bacterium]
MAEPVSGKEGEGRRFRNEILECRILIVEDDLFSRMIIKKVFQKEGFRNIEEAENGLIGLQKVHSFRPDMVISDIVMPQMDGGEMCRRIRRDSDPVIARIPILIQTALTQPEDKELIFAAGATDYICKPVDAREIITRSVVHLERVAILNRLKNFNDYFVHERGLPVAPEMKEDELWSFRRLSMTINVMLDEIELSHHEMKVAKDRAEKADQLKTEFLGNVTHELKTPLHCIMNFAQIGSSDCDKGKTERLKECFTDIYNNSSRLSALVSDLLDFSRMETGNMEFDRRSHSVRKLVENAVSFTQVLSNEKRLTVTIGDVEGSDVVIVDGRRAEQIFMNLMSNAIRFSPEGGHIQWSFASSMMNVPHAGIAVPAIRITIVDEGPGVPEHALETIFDPFINGRQVLIKGGGTGLGLAISRRLLQQFHGTVHAHNVPTGGALFEVMLPLQEAAEEIVRVTG